MEENFSPMQVYFFQLNHQDFSIFCSGGESGHVLFEWAEKKNLKKMKKITKFKINPPEEKFKKGRKIQKLILSMTEIRP